MSAMRMAFRGLVLTAAVFLGLPEVVDAGVTAANRAVIVEVEEDDVTIKSHGDGFTIFAGDKQMVHIKVTPQPGWKITTPPATELTPPGSTNYAAEGAREMTAAGRISAVPGHGTGHEEDNP